MTDEEDGKRDWRITAVLVAVWSVGLAVIVQSGSDIPTSMLLLATAFFVLLIPAMNDLVRSIDRKFGKPIHPEKKS